MNFYKSEVNTVKLTNNKYRQYHLIKKSKKLRFYLPETKRLNEKNLMKLINKYRKVILKPCRGRKGNGIIMISLKPKGEFELQHGKVILKGKRSLLKFLANKIGKRKKYIVQQYIPLATIANIPFDTRVMIQRRRRKKSPWVMTGKAAKVAHPDYVITNVTIKLLKVKKAIELSNINNKSPKKLISKLNKISLQTVKHLSRYTSKRCRAIGLDIGFDHKGNIWIFETNIKKPSIDLFRYLKDKTMYRRIKSYKASY
jgi:glutathione synthase/RimK-type ligase-like ATP-grasp enzyme